jgi:hypothetical protein
MNEYERIALLHFRNFEGAHLFPSWRSWLWYGWIGSFALFVWTIGNYLQARSAPVSSDPLWPMIGAELLFLAASGLIARQKHQATLAASDASPDDNSGSRLETARARSLELLLGVKATEFASTAKDIAELLQLRERFRLASDFEMSDVTKMVYDRDSKARLLAMVLAGVAAFVALLARAEPTTLPSMFDVLADSGLRSLLIALSIIVAIVFGLGLAAWIMMRQIAEGIHHWMMGLTRGHYASKEAIRYMVRDLVRLHHPTEPNEIRPPQLRRCVARSRGELKPVTAWSAATSQSVRRIHPGPRQAG